MKFPSFYLFYLQAILLFITGWFADAEAGFGSSPHAGLIYCLMAGIASLLTGLVYQLFLKLKRPVRKSFVLIHFALVLPGLLFSYSLYRLSLLLFLLPAPDTVSFASGGFSSLLMLLGPVLLIASFVIFAIGLATSKRTGSLSKTN